MLLRVQQPLQVGLKACDGKGSPVCPVTFGGVLCSGGSGGPAAHPFGPLEQVPLQPSSLTLFVDTKKLLTFTRALVLLQTKN